MKKQKIKRAIDYLEQSIDRMDRFQTKADRITEAEAPYRGKRRTKFTRPLVEIQQNARDLYHALSKTWCSTHSSHWAGLLLEQRLVQRHHRHGPHKKHILFNDSDTQCFEISIRQSYPLGRWLDLEIRLVEFNQTSHRSRFVSKCQLLGIELN